MADQTVYLVTGANRGKGPFLVFFDQKDWYLTGIGLGLTQALLGRPNVVVIAAVRDLATQAFQSIHLAENSKIVVVKIDSQSVTDAGEAVKTLQGEYGITKIDTVIANAGISKHVGPVIDTPISEIRDHFEVNALGVVVLFQAAWSLLRVSSQPRLVTLSTGIGR